MVNKILAFLGSPREKGNTATLMEQILKGAEQTGAKTEMLHISKFKMTGCKGCYTCKKEGESYGKCILKDDMTPIYNKIEEAEAVIFGSPVYMCAMTSELKMVLDRLFPYLKMDLGSILPKGKKSCLVFTQNQENPALFEWHFNMTAFMLKHIGFEKPEILVSVNTIGYKESDMDKMVFPNKEAIHSNKLKHQAEVFKQDMDKAFQIGKDLVS